AVLTPAETDHFFRVLRALREEGKSVLLATHKLREIAAVTDAVTVMRHGEIVATVPTAATTAEHLAELMVGRAVSLALARRAGVPGDGVLEALDLVVEDARGIPRVDGVRFTVRRGEIVGLAGVAGNGQSELLEALAGMRPVRSGRIVVKGRDVAEAGP